MEYQYVYCDWLVSLEELDGYLKMFNVAEAHNVSICVAPIETPDEYREQRIIIRFSLESDMVAFKSEISNILTLSECESIEASSWFVETTNLNSHPYNVFQAIKKGLINNALWNNQLRDELSQK